jgi:hypothetical protein
MALCSLGGSDWMWAAISERCLPYWLGLVGVGDGVLGMGCTLYRTYVRVKA